MIALVTLVVCSRLSREGDWPTSQSQRDKVRLHENAGKSLSRQPSVQIFDQDFRVEKMMS